jgi:hypothetical protein
MVEFSPVEYTTDIKLSRLTGIPEKPHLAPYHNAGTAEPMGVSPPEAVAYLLYGN